MQIGRKAASRYGWHRDHQDLVLIAAEAAHRRSEEDPDAPESHLIVAGRNAIIKHLRATECTTYMYRRIREGFDPSKTSGGRQTRLRITAAANIDDQFDLAAEGAGPAEVSADADLAELVREAVGGLKTTDREVLLRWADGTSFAAIAVSLGVTREAVRQRVEKNLGILRKRLATIGGEL